VPSPQDGGKCSCPPSLQIVLPLEGAPRIYVDSVSEWESSRLYDWISTHRELSELLDWAIAIRESWERAA
jgi:hypothetical protein